MNRYTSLQSQCLGRRPNNVGRLLVFASWLLFLSASGAVSYGQTITVCETEDYAYLDPYRGSGPAWERFVSLYCRPIQQFIAYSTSAPDKYENQRGFEVTQTTQGLKITVKSDAWFYKPKLDETGFIVGIDSSKITAKDIESSFRNWTSHFSDIGDKAASERIREMAGSISVRSDSEVFINYRSTLRPPRQPRAMADFPMVPAQAVPEGQATVNSHYLNKMHSHPWAGGPYVFWRSRVWGNAPVYQFRRVWPYDHQHYKEVTIEIVNDPLTIQTRLSQPQGDMCFPDVPPRNRNLVSSQLKIRTYKLPIVHQIVLNTRKPELQDPRVRRALSMLVDRQSLAETNLNNEVNIIGCPFGYGHFWSCQDGQESLAAYNPDSAAILLREAGWQRTGAVYTNGSQRLRVDIVGKIGAPNNWIQETTSAISDAWAAAGIESHPVQLTPAQYQKVLENHEFDAIFYIAHFGRYPEVDEYYLEGGIHNYSGIADQSIAAKWNQLLSETSSDGTLAAWRDLDCSIGRLAPSVFLWSPKSYAVYSDWINVGNNFSPNNFVGMIEKWTQQ